MKKIAFIIFTFYLLCFSDLYSFDTSSSRYLPLSTGNTWVYYGSGHVISVTFAWYSKYVVTGTVDTLGKRYWTIQETKFQIYGQNNVSLLMGFQRVRYDSITSNLYVPGNSCGNSETIQDSLASKPNDRAYKCYPNIYEICLDTMTFNIFNLNVPSKKFSNNQSSETVYSRDIGIASWIFGEVSIGYNMMLRGCIINGILMGDTTSVVGINKISSEIPKSFSLYQNYPNPFNPNTKIKFQITKLGSAKLIIYDALGREVATLVNERLQPGTYEAEWDGSIYPSGVYFYQLTVSSEQVTKYIETKKMVLIK